MSMGYDNPEIVRSLEPVMEVLRHEMRNRTVLEIACGQGFWTQRVVGSARLILASDYSESMLSMARAKAIDPSRVTFVRADAYDLSSVGGTFTGAFARRLVGARPNISHPRIPRWTAPATHAGSSRGLLRSDTGIDLGDRDSRRRGQSSPGACATKRFTASCDQELLLGCGIPTCTCPIYRCGRHPAVPRTATCDRVLLGRCRTDRARSCLAARRWGAAVVGRPHCGHSVR